MKSTRSAAPSTFPAAATLLLALSAAGHSRGEGGFSLSIGDARGKPGGDFAMAVIAEASAAYQGLSFSLDFPPGGIEIGSVDARGTIIEAIRADYFNSEVFPAAGILTVGILADAKPPFDGTLIPGPGIPLPIAWIRGRIPAGARADIPISFHAGSAPPAAPSIFSVENLPVIPDHLAAGTLRIDLPPPVPAFLRGDVNADARIDIADPVSVLRIIFLDGSPVPCAEAADANDDLLLDLSDAIFLFQFLYLGGTTIHPPTPSPGPSPRTRGGLGCEDPLFWVPSAP